jgi:hypothetical protein
MYKLKSTLPSMANMGCEKNPDTTAKCHHLPTRELLLGLSKSLHSPTSTSISKFGGELTCADEERGSTLKECTFVSGS